ncbi:hypothetical protein FPSM_02362 [Flavobacterium psychrophilum]|nr:hypothetical protein FPSM_02362 [Flavobacterium psychrophilum]
MINISKKTTNFTKNNYRKNEYRKRSQTKSITAYIR